MDPDAGHFAEMARALHSEPDVEHTIERIVEYAKDATACDDAGLMLLHGRGRIETAVATHPRVAAADDYQMECGEGPCVQTIWDDEAFIVKDTAIDERWPVWGPKAAELGLRSVLSLRLSVTETPLGALNLYGREPGMFSEDDLDVADIFVRHASTALAAAREEHGLRRAMGARHLVGQAQGILMERYGLDGDRAFALLRRYSQNHNVKLRDVAQMVVQTRKLPDGR